MILTPPSEQDTYKGKASDTRYCDDDALDAGLCWFDWWDVVMVVHDVFLWLVSVTVHSKALLRALGCTVSGHCVLDCLDQLKLGILCLSDDSFVKLNCVVIGDLINAGDVLVLVKCCDKHDGSFVVDVLIVCLFECLSRTI